MGIYNKSENYGNHDEGRGVSAAKIRVTVKNDK